MSVKTQNKLKATGRKIAIILFAILMFTNIKVAFLDESGNSSQDISLRNIELSIFEATYAECAPYCEVAFWDCRQWCWDESGVFPHVAAACTYGCVIGYNGCC